MPDGEYFIALGALVVMAVSVIVVAAFRFRENMLKRECAGSIGREDAMSMPIVGSALLFSLYVLLRFIPKECFNVMISLYLSVVSVFALGSFLERYMKPNVISGTFCVAVGACYWWTRSWVANDVLAFALGVTALEAMPVTNFATSYGLLVGLFFYDIFWVFGSDVMLTVAMGVDGPIKLLFPSSIFGSHEKKALLGLGDLIIPGLLICQTLVFSRDVVKRGYFYFIIAITAYFLALVNTMAVMIIFRHGQPALLFIVPWLLISITLAAVYKGDVKAAWAYELDAEEATTPNEAPTAAGETAQASKAGEDDGIFTLLVGACCHLFGLGSEESAAKSEAGDAIAVGERVSKKNA